jgi:hypothetical protein
MISIREARMHARRHRWIVLTLISTFAAQAGCRGTRPHDNLVQVTRDQDVVTADVEVPRQRLAVNKPRTGEQSDETGEQSDETGATANRLVSDQTEIGQPSTRPADETVSMQLADHRQPAATPQSESKTATQTAPPPARGSLPSDPIAEMSEQEMAAAFDSQPKYIKELALQQLTAAISRSAERTSQPGSVSAAIANSVDSLPELPAETGEEPKIPAKRIADSSSAHAATEASSAKVSGDGGSGLESVVVQSITDQSADKRVQTASASRDTAADSMVTRASGEPTAADAAPDVSKPVASELSDQALYGELLARLSREPVGESEAARNSRVIKQRHLMVLAGNPDAAVEKFDAMSAAEQEYLRHQLLGLWTMVDPQGHPVPSRRFTTALPQMREATKFAAAATDSLDVRSLAFCTAIESYGQIKTFPGNHFDAGQQVILYCEIENFTVENTAEGFQTHLQGSYDIFNADNEKVVSQLLPADKQVSANYLRDYFIAYQMHLPQQLSAGTYRLQLTMEDVSGKKYGQANIPLEIAK